MKTVILALILCAGTAFAKPGKLVVNGSATILLEPDHVTLTFLVERKEETASAAKCRCSRCHEQSFGNCVRTASQLRMTSRLVVLRLVNTDDVAMNAVTRACRRTKG